MIPETEKDKVLVLVEDVKLGWGALYRALDALWAAAYNEGQEKGYDDGYDEGCYDTTQEM